MPAEERDPSGFVTTPPSTFVKVEGTGRADINGLLGIVLSYNLDRQRYLVHMTLSQSIMAFKPENLKQTGPIETYVAQWQQLQNDPRVREKMAKYYDKVQQAIAPLPVHYAAIGLTVFIVVLTFLVGVVNMLMLLSLTVILLIIAAPDLLSKQPPHVILQNFPKRSKDALESNLPMMKGKLTNATAMAIIGFLIFFVLQTIFWTPKIAAAASNVVKGVKGNHHGYHHHPTGPVVSAETLKQFYNLGYQDAVHGREHGVSLSSDAYLTDEIIASTAYSILQDETMREIWEKSNHQHQLELQQQQQQKQQLLEQQILSNGEIIDIDVPLLDGLESTATAATVPPPMQQENKWSITNVASIFYLYRTIMELGTEQSTGCFAVAQFFANVQVLEVWRKILFGLSLYNVMRIFI